MDVRRISGPKTYSLGCFFVLDSCASFPGQGRKNWDPPKLFRGVGGVWGQKGGPKLYRGPKTHPKSRNTKKSTVFTRTFSKSSREPFEDPCAMSQEFIRNCSKKLVQMNFYIWGGGIFLLRKQAIFGHKKFSLLFFLPL